MSRRIRERVPAIEEAACLVAGLAVGGVFLTIFFL